MVRFIKKNRNFQFKGILMILGCFILIAAVLFAERSGVQYQEKKRQISYIDKDKIITEKEAADSLKKTCLVLRDSSQKESEQAWIEFQRIFMDMRVGTDVIDIQRWWKCNVCTDTAEEYICVSDRAKAWNYLIRL